MPEILPNFHPLFVHFTVALFSTSFGTLILSLLTTKWEKLRNELLIVSRWCLWLSALMTFATIATGLYAYYTVEHDSLSHHIMGIHRNWGLVTFFAIEFMGLWSLILYFKQKRVNWIFVIGKSISFALVMITGWYGSELVYRYGTGVLSIPEVRTIEHPHSSD